jgi:hypothetical protein
VTARVAHGWGCLIALGLAAGAVAQPLMTVEVAEPKGMDVGLVDALRAGLAEAGFHLTPQPLPGAAAVPGPHCTLRGRAAVSRVATDYFVRYSMEVVSESGVTLAQDAGELARVRTQNIRSQIVNGIRSKLTAALLAHPWPNHLLFHGVRDDERAVRLKSAVTALPGRPSVVAEHYSNGDLSLEIASRVSAERLAEPLATLDLGDGPVRVEYAGVDTLEARLP